MTYNQAIADDNALSYFDEFPQDAPFTEEDANIYQQETTSNLISLVREYLRFGSARDLLRIIASEF